MVLNGGSEILAETEAGTGGRIEISAEAVFRSPDSRVSADAGVGVSGTVEINSPDVQLIGQLVRLPQSTLEVEEMLSEDCAARAEQRASFGVRGPEAPPSQPGDLQPGHVSMP